MKYQKSTKILFFSKKSFHTSLFHQICVLFLLILLFHCQYEPKNNFDLLLLTGQGPGPSDSTTGGVDFSNPTSSATIAGWENEAYIKANNVGLGGALFGHSLAISENTMVIGAYRESSNQIGITNGSAASVASMNTSAMDSGAAYVFRNISGNWVLEAYLKASNTNPNDRFGWSVAISGNTIVVGATGNGASGSAYVFVFDSGTSTWTQEALLKAPNFGAGDQFGSSVAIDGDLVVVGAQWEDSDENFITNGPTASANNSKNDSGAAYIFRRTGVIWTQEAYLKTPNPDNNDYFGSSVAISGDTVVVGAPQEGSLSGLINGTTASADNSKFNSGAAYVFRKSGPLWVQEAFLKASNLDSNDQFGKKISISGNTIAVGAPFEDSNQSDVLNGSVASSDNSVSSAGAVYVFERSGTSWAQAAFLKAKNVQGGDQFGSSVSIDGNIIAVGSINESSNQSTITNGNLSHWNEQMPQSGSVYVFSKSAVWSAESYLKAPNPGSSDLFGWSVGVHANKIVVGATQECSNQTTITNGNAASADDSAFRAGAAYVFRK
ncbi:FG-GAP repeat protein [Leptospira sp. 201903070]|uniref:FG-GAP repeat protein n=1 Tax=Leptospira ainlahdjerensis TaxID=2810033 RepID=A0ABS2UDC5_9LEPT|nr:FG-GAP repeat protein [Leptospira ainlahdjerensis]MBM9578358.1 FG-GAP repeat protein [Leptospira ainlahdjerensis]